MPVNADRNAKRYYKSGQFVPLDGLYGDMWGGWLPFMKGDQFPSHPTMGASKWSYEGPLATGLPELRKASHTLRK
ncbi:hypothetical protein [Paenibacillus silvisoli]|uniref:hypothetical protein n=1 Tax=Paenibacillus silvisoli TaxID=3110539 RepID=UPI002805065F|nr:hypothetical protein [Paenibacillus silvisoli]